MQIFPIIDPYAWHSDTFDDTSTADYTTAGDVTAGKFILGIGSEIEDDGSGWTQFSGNGALDGGLGIAIPQSAGSDFYWGYGGTENHYFGQAGDVLIGYDGTMDVATTLYVGTMRLDGGSITDTSGAISFGNEALSTDGTIAAHLNAVTSGSKFSYKTAAITPDYVGIIEIISDLSNLLPAGTESGIEVEAFFDADDAVNAQLGGAFFNKATGTLTGQAASQYGIFGGVHTTIDNDGITNIPALYGLSFSVFNNEDFDGGIGKQADHTLNTRGLTLVSYLGYDGKTISNLADVENYGGFLEAIMDGTYNSTRTDGVNYGGYFKTTDSLTDASGDLVSYGLYIDACADNTLGSGGVLTSWGLVEANGRNNALAGNLRLGSLTAPTEALHFADAKNIAFDTNTGTKIGTATSQKIGFWNVTPVIQQSHIVDAANAAGDPPTQAEFNALVGKFNTLLAQMAAIGLQAAA